MALVCANCTLGKIFKILLVAFCGLFFLEYFMNVKMIDKVYATSKSIKNTLPIQWPMQNKSYLILSKNSDEDDVSSTEVKNVLVSADVTEKSKTTSNNDNPCPAEPPGLVGPININLTDLSLSDVENMNFNTDLGGHYSPSDCKAKDKVAIIIPFRNREAHLSKFLNNMHPFLMKQQIEYKIYVVEQKGDTKFNRAKLFNIGFVEASKEKDWDCFIFHDVDLLPMDDRNLYTCPPQPRHLTVAIDKFDFVLPYNTIFGGATVLTKEQFKTVNGFSNSFWGWGGEDDDMYNRLKRYNFEILRYPSEIARYTMFQHEDETPNPKRWRLLEMGEYKIQVDGLNSLKYALVETKTYKTYTLFLVDVQRSYRIYD